MTRTEVPIGTISPGQPVLPGKPRVASCTGGIENPGPLCESGASWGVSASDLPGDPWFPPPAWPKLWTLRVYVNSAVAGECRLLPARGVSGACGPLFVYLVSVVTQGRHAWTGSLGQRTVGVPAVPAHKAPTLSTRSRGVFFHKVRI